MTQQDFLTKLGLSNKQIKIYLDLATYPESTVVDIHKRAQLPRSSIYLELERLTKKGLIIQKKVGKSTYFKITDPKNLKLTLEDQTDTLNFLTQNLDEFHQSVKQLTTAKDQPKTINIYKGQAGIKQMLWNIILSKADLVIGYSPGTLEDITDRKFSEKWRQAFKDQSMHNQIIFNKPTPLTWSDVPGFLKENVEAKTLNPKKIKFDRMTLIYNDVFTVCSLKTDQDQYGIEIRDKLLIDSYKQMFNFIWNHVAKKL